jgi:hypothetical protein
VEQAAAGEVVAVDVVVVEDAGDNKFEVMKTIIIHTISIAVSFFWLVAEHQTFNPVTLKGPEFLQFYLILLSGFYISILSLKFFKETFSKTAFYFMLLILILGIIKLIRGLFLGKPVGYLVIMIIFEIITAVIFILIKPSDS